MQRYRRAMAALALATLAVGCSSGSADRQAAGASSDPLTLPSCGELFDGECVWDITQDGPDSLVVENGSTVLFAHNGQPATGANISVLCWSAGNDVDAGSCTEDGKQPPVELGISMTTVTQGGRQWPALQVRSLPVEDGTSEPVLALPATVVVGVNTSDEGILPVTVEVACCNRLS